MSSVTGVEVFPGADMRIVGSLEGLVLKAKSKDWATPSSGRTVGIGAFDAMTIVPWRPPGLSGFQIRDRVQDIFGTIDCKQPFEAAGMLKDGSDISMLLILRGSVPQF